ncbi:MAG: restriction endonuclease subunit S, partial [Flammeovirgaceae bacterium]
DILGAVATFACRGRNAKTTRLSDQVLTITYYLSDSNCGQYLIQKSFYGQTKPGLNFKQIENFEILIPPIELQTRFVQIVEKKRALKTQYQQSLQELENLYGSLSQKAFKGELAVKQLA